VVIVYRESSLPLKSVVIYEGAHTKRAFSSFTQTIAGIYQAAATPNAKMTHIVGDGRWFLSERVRVNGQSVATNPFVSSDGPKWDNQTFYNLPVPSNAASALIKVEPHGLLPDCLTYSAIVLSANVKDSDADGLIDIWESSETQLFDPKGNPLPNLKAMGANAYVKDIFAEIGYLKTDMALTYGGVQKPAHSHLPTYEALRLVANALAGGPPSTAIKIHFDVGNNYQDSLADGFIIPAEFARGGEFLFEQACSQSEPGCQYPQYPGTVGWKTGFRFFRDEPLDAPNEDECALLEEDGNPVTVCERRFDKNRHHMFRYVLYAHSIGVPVSPDEFISGGSGNIPNPDFHVPRTNTGVADFPGADVLLTLGAFNDSQGRPVGTDFMVASTLLHEFGHNLERRHGGDAGEPNCKSNYLSVMNYQFQLRGLLKDGDDKTAYLDFSGQTLNNLDEASLVFGLSPLPPYRSAWFAPATAGVSPAPRFCTGAEFPDPPPSPMARFVGELAGQLDFPAASLDVNFDGVPDQLHLGSNDWANLHLNQLGSRRNAGGLFLDDNQPTIGPLSLSVGKGDLGKGDLGKGDLGKGDLGKGDLGKGDLGKGDLGKGDLGTGSPVSVVLGKGDLGKGDLGAGDLGTGGPGEPLGEPDFTIVTALNARPVAANDNYSTPVNVVLTVDEPGVLGNDTDTDDPVLTAVLVDGTGPFYGELSCPTDDSLMLCPDGSFTYTPNLNFVGTDTFKYTANDVSLSSEPATVTIAVTADHAPAGTDKTVATKEDIPYIFSVSDFGFTDPNDYPPDAFVAVKITTLPAAGTLKLGTTPVYAGAFVLKTDIAYRKLKFFPAANASGSPYTSFTFQVKDSRTGGSNLDLSPNTMTINVTPINDAPAGTNKIVTTPKNTSYTFTESDFGFTDPYDSPANAFVGVKIVSLCNVTIGTLKLNGYAVASGTFVTKADIDAGKLMFVPAPNKTGMTSFTFKVKDDGGTAYGGVNLDPSPNTMTVKVVHPY
jgi:hypothetical protein